MVNFRRNKTELNRSNLVRSSKEYKKIIRQEKIKSQRQFEKKIRNLKSLNSKAYWKKISNKPHKKTIPIKNDKIYEHFKKLNLDSNVSSSVNHDYSQYMDISCEELDGDCCADEIISAINMLKTNKTHGSDNVLNEYIKSTKDVFLPIYIRLFNYILQTGSIPETWLVGRILPIYKNKGDIHEPENYRGISILSCFGKFFTSVLNNRLTEFKTISKAINENQAGFRKNYSTIDHLFVLKNVIDLHCIILCLCRFSESIRQCLESRIVGQIGQKWYRRKVFKNNS